MTSSHSKHYYYHSSAKLIWNSTRPICYERAKICYLDSPKRLKHQKIASKSYRKRILKVHYVEFVEQKQITLIRQSTQMIFSTKEWNWNNKRTLQLAGSAIPLSSTIQTIDETIMKHKRRRVCTIDNKGADVCRECSIWLREGCRRHLCSFPSYPHSTLNYHLPNSITRASVCPQHLVYSLLALTYIQHTPGPVEILYLMFDVVYKVYCNRILNCT